MVFKCAAENCVNNYENCVDYNISFHSFPKDNDKRKIWLLALGKSENWVPSTSYRVCSIHFKEDDFFPSRKRIKLCKKTPNKTIKQDAVPSVLESSLFPTLKERLKKQDPIPTQASSKKPENFHNYAKVPSVASVSKEYELSGICLPVVSSESEPESDDETESEAKSISSPQFLSSGSYISHTTQDSQSDYTLDPTQGTQTSQESEEMEHEFDEFPELEEPHLEDKYIVFASNLLLLFKMCQICHKEPIIKMNRTVIGSFLLVKTECLGGCEFEWKSQPQFGNTSYGNYFLAACIYFSGLLPTKTLNAFRHFKLKVFSTRMYFYYQRMFHPVIEKLWKTKQDILINDAKQKQNLTICGDGRADSPGFSAKYGTYVFMNPESKKIIHTELVQSSEVSSSNQMELEGLKRGLSFFKTKGVGIYKIVSDRNLGIIAFLRKSHQDILHEFDNWHVAKNINSKLKAVSKKKGNEKLQIWLRAIVNHVYWVGASSKSSEERIAKWTSLLNHLCNIHVGHSQIYPKCCHETISQEDARVWLVYGSDLFKDTSAVIRSPFTLAAIAQLSSDYQTYALEVFNSVLNSFCPKRIHFHHDSMNSRILLACLHYNENGDKSQKEDEEGEKQYYLAFPKAKQGEPTVKKILEASTFVYVEELIEIAYERAESEGMAITLMAPPCHFETLSSKFNKDINKSDLVAKHQSRFKEK